MAYIMLALGDSVMWGQGLRASNKFRTQVASYITALRGTDVDVVCYAHSGAQVWQQNGADLWGIIDPTPPKLPNPHTPSQQELEQQRLAGRWPRGTEEEREAVGEMPNRQTYTWCQLEAASRVLNVDDVRLVLIDGGINDVEPYNIILPHKNHIAVYDRIESFRGSMSLLLMGVHQRFPRALIVVTGYYPIVSRLTDFRFALRWIASWLDNAGSFPIGMQALAQLDQLGSEPLTLDNISTNSPFYDLANNMVRLSTLLDWRLNAVLRHDIDAFNTAAHQRLAEFAEPAFAADNSIYAPNSYLWQLDQHMNPRDQVRVDRIATCMACADSSDCFQTGDDALSKFLCRIASIGHPNMAGMRAYRTAVLAACSRLGVI